jgi:HEAT repeat protein
MALEASDPKARLAAADALGMLRASGATEKLAEMAERDSDVAARTHAVRALGEIADPKTTPLLVRLLGSSSRWVRMSGAFALGQFADGSVVPAVRAASKRERFVLRGAYRKAIRRISERGRSQSP